ncbi:MAG: Polysaccharide biosynthesis/export protein [Syntrophorhabdus sp. PtaU1.Bin050]|nr:MAG: Polysaccharide biosynthesis/export protein [Syntrophorhabdus sp. PtaU1.Bin050]
MFSGKNGLKAERFILLGILLFATSCSMGPLVKNRADFTLPQNFLYPHAQLYTSDTQYRIQPGDTLDVKFFYNPELNAENIPVRPDGRISLQLIDDVRAAGFTPEELRNLLKRRYEDTELRDVYVAVIVRTMTGQKVFIDGEVGRPGLVTLIGPMTILQALAQSALRWDTARLNEVIVIRRGADNRRIITTVNLKEAIDGNDPNQDILLMPYDIVYVPKTPIANVDVWVDQYIRRMIPFPLPYVIPTPGYVNQ